MKPHPCARLYLLLLLLTTGSAAHSQTATLKQSQISHGDVATLVVEYRNHILSLFQLDTTALEVDFDVLDVKSSVHRDTRAAVNTNIMRWEISLAPRRVGQLTLPALTIRDTTTEPLTLQVSAPDPDNLEIVEVQLSATPTTPYVGEQIIVTTSIRHNRPLPGSRLSEHETTIGNRFLRHYDEPRTQRIAGLAFEIRERKLAVFAAQAGEVTLPAAVLRADIENLEPAPGAATTRKIHRRSQPLTLQVKPVPDQHTAPYWLPARDIRVTQQWSTAAAPLLIGDTISRTIIIEADGLMAESLPPDLLEYSDDTLTVFADRSTLQNHFDGNRLSGTLTQQYLVVFSATGEIRAPDFQLHWWDTTTNTGKILTIAGKTVPVTMPAIPPDKPLQTRSVQRPLTVTHRSLPSAALAALLATLLAAAGYLAMSRLRGSNRFRQRWRSRQQLRRACLNNNPAGTRQALLRCARLQWPDQSINGLDFIKRRAGPRLLSQLARLEQQLYHTRNSPAWSGAALWHDYKSEKFRLDASPETTGDALPALYPTNPHTD